MNESIKKSVQKGIEVYTSGKIEEEEKITNKMFLLVAKKYYKKNGYLPSEWQEYIANQINKGASNE